MAEQYQLIGRKKVKTKAGRDFYEYYFYYRWTDLFGNRNV